MQWLIHKSLHQPDYQPKCEGVKHMEIYCNNCGTLLTDEQIFCPTCSNNVRYVDKPSLIEAYKNMWTHYVDFKGRTRRSEYWYVVLANMIITLILALLTSVIPAVKVLMVIYGLAILIPSFSLAVRRLHDTGRSGHWLWLILTVYGAIALIVFYCQDKKQPINKYGNSPKWYSVYDLAGGDEENGNI